MPNIVWVSFYRVCIFLTNDQFGNILDFSHFNTMYLGWSAVQMSVPTFIVFLCGFPLVGNWDLAI